jgi:hypothetical protein
MNNLTTPVLGEITAFTISTTDLEKSLACYKLLGFSELFRADWPFPWIQITDGVILILLIPFAPFCFLQFLYMSAPVLPPLAE